MVKWKTTTILISTTAVLVAGIAFVGRAPHKPPVARQKPLPVPSTRSLPALEKFVAQHKEAKEPEIQDRVGAARVRMGYAMARSKGYPKARELFLQTAKTHRGTGAQSAEFGGVADQAAYQAIVCLVAEDKKDQAVKEFEAFMKNRPLSPLVHAAYQRLERLNGGEPKPEWDRLLQEDIAKQEAHVRFETSVCGPKCLRRITGKDYKEFAKRCGTNSSGTTMEGMRKGLKSFGQESWAVQLNRDDLDKAALPAILLEDDHYVVIEKIDGDVATLWDPRFSSSRVWKLAPIGDPDFSATLILLSRPEGL